MSKYSIDAFVEHQTVLKSWEKICMTRLDNNSKNMKIYFSYVSAYWASFMKTGSKLKGGGGDLHILVGKRPISHTYISYISQTERYEK